jgi:ribosomal protein S27AE
MDGKSDRFITVATFRYPVEAHLAKSKLESEGIEVYVADENIVAINWLYSNAVGGVKVQVREDEADRARALLQAPQPERRRGAGKIALLPCPKCGSAGVSLERQGRVLEVVWLVLFFLPIARPRHRWRCAKCGYTVID